MAKSFVIATEGDALAWYSMLRPGSIYSWENLWDKILANFQGFTAKSVTSTDLFQCRQSQEEALRDYFQRFVQTKAKAPGMPEEVAIEAAIKGLRIGLFTAHLAREKPTSMHELYHEFEKYCKSDNDFRKRLEEQNSQKKQVNDRNLQKKNLSQDGRRPQQEAGGQMMNIEQPRNDKSGQNHPPAEARNSGRGFNQAGGGQNRGWQKNQKQRQQKQYCFFHGEEKGHSTRDCPDAKETQERIKNRSAPQPPSLVIQPREVNHHSSSLACHFSLCLLSQLPTGLAPSAATCRARPSPT